MKREPYAFTILAVSFENLLKFTKVKSSYAIFLAGFLD